MCRPKTIAIILVLCLCSVSAGKKLSERRKITLLLDVVEKSNVTFIRNGAEYPAKRARQHLELKLRKAGTRIRTARQFIKYLATRSSWTGRPYYIRTKDKRKVPAARWLTARLLEIERKHGL